jgi:SufS family cysteine desulfurase
MLLCQLVKMNYFDHLTFRHHFPLLSTNFSHDHSEPIPLVYFDNGATTQKPYCVIDCYRHFYSNNNANVHRSSHALSARATTDFERARVLVKTFIHAKSTKEVIWTKGSTEGINLVAHSFAVNYLKSGDEILLSQCEHHANIVPWQIVAEKTGAVINVMPIDNNGRIDKQLLSKVITSKTKIVSFAHISNVLGRINPIKEIIVQAKTVGAITLIDGAQAIPHLPVDVQALGCDFYVFSAHKMYGPTGVGVLYGREELLTQMVPYQAGGEMIDKVSFSKGTTYNQLPFKFEAGTPNVAGISAFSKAIEFLNTYLDNSLMNYEYSLIDYVFKQLKTIQEVKFIADGQPDIPVISFTLTGHHNHDVASALDSFGIAVRSGHHCAMPLMDYLGISGCLRISLAAYNTFDEIDFFIEKLKAILTHSTNLDYSNIKSPIIKSELGSTLASDDILALFGSVNGWDGRHRQIMLLSKQLSNIPDNHKNEHSLISGCESLAWLTYVKDKRGNFFFKAYSDAKVIRGLLVIILAAFNHKNRHEIEQFDLQGYFDELGLIHHLSPSRGNGVRAIVDKIKVIIHRE